MKSTVHEQESDKERIFLDWIRTACGDRWTCNDIVGEVSRMMEVSVVHQCQFLTELTQHNLKTTFKTLHLQYFPIDARDIKYTFGMLKAHFNDDFILSRVLRTFYKI